MEKDAIIMKGMQFFGKHGVLIEEQTLGQPFTVDVELYVSLKKAGQTDNLQNTVNYGQVYMEIKDIVENKRFQLIEALAEAIADSIMQKHEIVQGTKVQIQKPQAPIAGIFNYMGVEINRSSVV